MELKSINRTKVYSFEGYEVEMLLDMSMSVYDLIKDVSNKELNNDETLKKFYSILPNMIIDWNFADKDNKKLEINKDNLGKLPLSLFNWLVGCFNEVFTENNTTDKKKQLS